MARYARPQIASPVELSRRHFFQSTGLSLGGMALAALPGPAGCAAELVRASGGLPGLPHHPPRARSVIYLQMLGGPSQLDLFDHKPELNARHGQDVPPSLMQDERFAFISGTKKFLGTPYRFAQYGQCGAPVCEHLPELAGVVDELTFIKSMQTDQFNHGPAQIQLTTGFSMMGMPSMGSWIHYGLGSANDDLPTFVVLVPGMRNSGGKSMFGAGFLPANYQGVEFRVSGDPVPSVKNPPGVSAEARADTIRTLAELNQLRGAEQAGEQVAASVASYELAYRLQTSVPGLMDIADEPAWVHAAYGTDKSKTNFARCCLLARRLVERGVRFVQICYEGETMAAIWDSHGDTRRASLEAGLPFLCKQIDRPIAALVRDLKQRGLLDETLLVWGGEFGRTPMNEDRPGAAEPGFTGRDHWPKAGTMFLAGGGVRPGITVGETDELGFHVTRDPVHVHDLNATILHLLGIDHLRLTHRYQGRDFRLTDVHGRVVEPLLA
ncbi:MAG: DUF1501 domain-containing protein [Pirellulales bacterium]|nr:DUF1501 domain-containing protein [Pirellulales bacterium]